VANQLFLKQFQFWPIIATYFVAAHVLDWQTPDLRGAITESRAQPRKSAPHQPHRVEPAASMLPRTLVCSTCHHRERFEVPKAVAFARDDPEDVLQRAVEEATGTARY
jgi:hypothetical protein